MNLRFYIICAAALLVSGVLVLPALGVPFLAGSSPTATVHGVTYAWDTLEPINDTVIDVNSTPPQSIVAKDGTYSFELPPGNYAITARYYRNNSLIYSKETTFKVEGEGNYVLDLLLYPVSGNRLTGTIAAETSNLNGANHAEQTGTDLSTTSYVPVAFTLFLLLVGSYKLSRKHKKTKKNRSREGKFNISGLLVKALSKNIESGTKPDFGNTEGAASMRESVIEPAEFADNSEIETAALKKLPLSSDLREVLDIIRGHKGRITQKDLRSKLEYSEVKVSLLLSELEKRKLIKKFKNGRENIVILIGEEQRQKQE